MQTRIWTVVGIISSLAVLSLAVALTAGEPLMFLNLPGLALVLGGTFAATLTSYSLGEIVASLRAIARAMGSAPDDDRSDLREILRVAKVWKDGDVHRTEAVISRVTSPFLQTGLRLVVDGASTDQLVDVADWRIGRLRAHGYAEADVFNSMAIYAPAFGMVGTLLGLVDMLREVGGGIDQIGASLAMALVTTFYGIVLANAVFKPLAVKLRRRTQDRMAVLSVAKEALVMMADRHSPAQLRYTLGSFIDPDDPDLIQAPSFSASAAPAHG